MVSTRSSKPQTDSTLKSDNKRKRRQMPKEFNEPFDSFKQSRPDVNSFPSTSTDPTITTHLSHLFLDSKLYASKECGGRGNCLFLSISYQLPKIQKTIIIL